MRFLVPLLLVYYIALGLRIKREAIPGLGAQAFIWFLYIIIGFLLYRSLKKSRGVEVERVVAPSLRRLVMLSLVWILSGVAFSTLEIFLHELRYVILIGLWVFGALIGLISFFRSVRWALTK